MLFNQSFPTAENVRWYDEENAHVVFFKVGEITNRMTYNLKNEFVKGERYYDENTLPVYILFAIKKKYKKEQIFGVTELTDQTSIYYHVVLKDHTIIRIIDVFADGSIQLDKTYSSAFN